ncbi:hypothetical protein FA10DRAFT_261426 [Acaromyces ingoldii]|uniref:Uncharacterized protein n=1 Tax=Acaromyces ingoldii TaxID=215250 RepID=A0A316YKE5_9BASI|nr:hypothetical protein FA10DRAFT_261426 [Acaromyces ingoldii]PWN89652.1 hypothetical protein FA10DRAFT_261426 [Acaromyces ingoldii]
MKFAILATTLLVLLLTSTCGASAQDSHEDDEGCRQVLVKRSLIESSSENSPPMSPRLGFDFERGKPEYYVMRIREELEREKRKQSAVGPSRRRWSTTRNAVRPLKGPIGENIALSDDTIDQTDDEETYNVETESDSSSTRRRESAWGHNNVPRTMTRRSKHLKGSKIDSSEPSEENAFCVSHSISFVGKRISFRDHLAAEKPLFMEEMELTPEQFSLLSHARTRQDFDKLASKIQSPFKLTKDQVKKLETEGKFDNQFKYEVRNFRKRNSTRAKRRKITRQRMQTQGSFDAPESYKGLEGEEYKRLRAVLTTLLGNLKAIEAGKESLDLVDGQDLRLVDQWTQEDLDWWKKYLEFRKTFHRIPKTEQLLQEIEIFFTQGKGRAYEEAGRKAT